MAGTDSFKISFVKDDAGDELGSGMSTARSGSHENDDVTNDEGPLLDEEIESCYVSCEITTVQPAKKYNDRSPVCLVIFAFVFHPAIGRHFRWARISCAFQPSMPPSTASTGTGTPATAPAATADPPPPPVGLTIMDHVPRTAYGGFSKVDGSWTFGLSAPIQAQAGVASFSIVPSAQKSTSKTVEHYMVIKGSTRGNPKRKAVWTLEGNNSTGGGLPLEIQTATILHHKLSFTVDVSIEASLGPLSKIKSRSNRRLVDPTVARGRQFPIKESLDELKLGEWFSGAMVDSIIALQNVIPAS